jgi:hypothetical protein
LGQQGRFAESLAAAKRGHELGTKQPGWNHPSAEWVRQGERLVALEGKLPAFRKGEFKPKDTTERLDMARVCQTRKLHFAAARLFADAFAADAKLAGDLKARHRYNAASSAALAAAGQGEDAAKLGDLERARLRKQALDWLRADLGLRIKQLESGKPADVAEAQQNLQHWHQDRDLASIRDAASLAKLPVNERAAFTQLWADVDTRDTLVLLQSGVPPLLKSAAVQAWFRQDKEFGATCDRALKAGKDTKDPVTAERVAKICSLRRSDDKTHEAALVLARRAVEVGKGHGYFANFQMALGMAEYRSGHFAAADAALLAASQLGNSKAYLSGTTAFYQAMSLFRQGKEAEARKLASAAAAKMKPFPADEKNPLSGNASADDLILWMAYKEAKALIQFNTAPPAKAANNKSK